MKKIAFFLILLCSLLNLYSMQNSTKNVIAPATRQPIQPFNSSRQADQPRVLNQQQTTILPHRRLRLQQAHEQQLHRQHILTNNIWAIGLDDSTDPLQRRALQNDDIEPFMYRALC
jgi:hypothetical protein